MTLEVPMGKLWRVLYRETERSPEWHPNMSKNEVQTNTHVAIAQKVININALMCDYAVIFIIPAWTVILSFVFITTALSLSPLSLSLSLSCLVDSSSSRPANRCCILCLFFCRANFFSVRIVKVTTCRFEKIGFSFSFSSLHHSFLSLSLCCPFLCTKPLHTIARTCVCVFRHSYTAKQTRYS